MAKSTNDEVDQMFDQAAHNEDDFADVDDLLDKVVEDDAEGWTPKEKGEGIAGKLVKIGETKSDFADRDEDAMVPTWTIQTRSGDKLRVIGYSSVLKREMRDSDAEVGDKVAVKYFGEKVLKTGKFQGKNYKHFGIAVIKS